MMMKNFQLLIAYRGTAYNGWQIQPNGLCIQELIQQAIFKLTGESVNLIASGRTDAGVHALKQSAHFFTNSTIPPEKMPLALNTKLPADIRILDCYQRPEDFHSRYSAIGKTYLYKIIESKIGDPFAYDLMYQIPYVLNWKGIEKASQAFLGSHDFSAFMASGSAVKSTIRTIETVSFQHHDNQHKIIIKGNGFLYNMVRIMVGTLMKVSQLNLNEADLQEIILSKDRSLAGPTVPARGLYLKAVDYPKNETFS